MSADSYKRQSNNPNWRAKKAKQKRDRWNQGYRYDFRGTRPIDYYATMMLSASKRKAKSTGMEHNLTKDWLIERLGEGICPATGLQFSFAPPQGSRCNPRSPSLDRVDSRKGYTKDNCQIVMSWYNVAKNDYEENEILELMAAVTARNRDINGMNDNYSGPKHHN